MEISAERYFTNKVNIALRLSAVQIQNEIEGVYEEAITRFYKRYRPKRYERTYASYYGSDNFSYNGNINGILPSPKKDEYGILSSKSKDKPEKHGSSYICGITVFYENLFYGYTDDNYHDTFKYVFERTFEQGIHGRYGIGRPGNPSKYMEREFNHIKTKKHLSKVFNDNLTKVL